MATAGELASFELLTHDAHNKPMTYGGEQFAVRLVRHSRLEQTSPGGGRAIFFCVVFSLFARWEPDAPAKSLPAMVECCPESKTTLKRIRLS